LAQPEWFILLGLKVKVFIKCIKLKIILAKLKNT